MRQRLGQHFLSDQNLAHAIAELTQKSIFESQSDHLIEIGPGHGALTHPILKLIQKSSVQKFTLIEKDRTLVQFWKLESEKNPFLKALEGDFLDLDTSLWLTGQRNIVVSNLPYCAGTAILTQLARHPQQICSMILMFQAEVGERLRAQPKSKAWGSLSIWIQNQWEVTKFKSVSRNAFTPPPQVASEVLIFKPRAAPLITTPDAELWETLLKASFAHRRKMLRSGLSSQPVLKKALESTGIDTSKRAEALNWEEWNTFYQAALSCAKR